MPNDVQHTPTATQDQPDVRGCSCGMADYGAPGHDGDPNAMPARQHYVVVERVETIRYDLLAHSTDDSEQRYLTDGDETGSKTISMTVIKTGLA
ncbi:hypothetical protein OG225_41885 (plasmid) [Nocardia sp. NBC_01377]|uniref:hypothetical protein n=1 Tax=Nocardia sp. NBC_01377 TaxID=2903595 RepID=UPI002F910369